MTLNRKGGFFGLPLVCLLAAICLAGGCASTVKVGGKTVERKRIDAAIEKVKPALVRIHVVEPVYRSGREQKFQASGSGAIITPEGHVVTNHHVAGKAVRIFCTMPNREEIPAVLLGTDAATDIAVIKLMPEDGRTFPVAEFGDSEELTVGDVVLAMGSPRGISQSVTRGIVSNTEMIMPSYVRGAFTLDGENVGELVRWIAHDAEIHGGNSGGPLVDLTGDIIGINEISFGLAGAIPGNLAREVAFELIERADVERAYVGIILQPLLKSMNLQQGALVGSVLKKSPAEEAGLKPGDIIMSINGEPIIGQFYEDLPLINQKLAALPVEEEVDFEIRRGGEEMTLGLTPTRRQPARMPEEEVRAWGATFRDLSMFTKLNMAREDERGVLVTSVSPGGPAAKAKPDISSNDVIVSLNNEPVANLQQFFERTKAIQGDATEPVPALVGFERDNEQFLTVVEIGIEDLDDPGAEVRKAWLPMETQVFTTDLAEKLDREDIKGVRVTRIYGERAEDFPFEVGDIITEADGYPVDASQPHDVEVFRTLIRQYRIGSEPEFTVLREGEEITVTTELLTSPKKIREMMRWRSLEFDFIAREATFYERQDPKMEGVDVNVIAESVTDGGWAALGGLNVGDAILALNGDKVSSLDDLEMMMREIAAEEPTYVIMEVRRGIRNIFLEIEPFWEDLETVQ